MVPMKFVVEKKDGVDRCHLLTDCNKKCAQNIL
jgi:hypothetical protein